MPISRYAILRVIDRVARLQGTSLFHLPIHSHPECPSTTPVLAFMTAFSLGHLKAELTSKYTKNLGQFHSKTNRDLVPQTNLFEQ